MSDYDLDSVDVNVENGTAMNRNGDHSRSGTMVGKNSPGRGKSIVGSRKSSQISMGGKRKSNVSVDYAKLEKFGSRAIGRQMSVNMSRGRPSRLKTPLFTPDTNQNDDSCATAHSKVMSNTNNMEELSEEEDHEISDEHNGTVQSQANGNDQYRDSTVVPLTRSKFSSEQVGVEPNKNGDIG